MNQIFQKINNNRIKIIEFIRQCKRVLLISKKPSNSEYIVVSKISGLGICILGILGFIIHVPIAYLKSII